MSTVAISNRRSIFCVGRQFSRIRLTDSKTPRDRIFTCESIHFDMRNILVVMLLAGYAATAQPTILQEHLPQAGQIFTANNDYQGGDQFLPTPPSSSAQIWDYTSAFGTTASEQVVFLPANEIIGYTNFPEATSGLSYTFGTSQLAIFYSSGSEGFKVEGFYHREDGMFTVVTTHYDDIHIPVPLTYGNELTLNVLEEEVKIYDDETTPAEMHRRWTTRTMTADAFGTLMTPAWPTGVEVIRHKYETLLIVDSLFADASGTGNGPWQFQYYETNTDVEVDYNFLRAGQPLFVMEFSGDGSFATYYDNSITTSIEGVPDLARSVVHPNPATDAITFDLRDQVVDRIEILDADGRILRSVNLSMANVATVDLSGVSAGAYIYSLTSNGVVIDRGRFIKAR